MKRDDETKRTDSRDGFQMLDDTTPGQRAEEVSARCEGELLMQFE